MVRASSRSSHVDEGGQCAGEEGVVGEGSDEGLPCEDGRRVEGVEEERGFV